MVKCSQGSSSVPSGLPHSFTSLVQIYLPGALPSKLNCVSIMVLSSRAYIVPLTRWARVVKEPTSTREGAMGGGAGVGIRPDITGMWARFSCSPIHTRNEKNDRNNKNEGSTVITEMAGLMMTYNRHFAHHLFYMLRFTTPWSLLPPSKPWQGWQGLQGWHLQSL